MWDDDRLPPRRIIAQRGGWRRALPAGLRPRQSYVIGFSAACERNKAPLLDQLAIYFAKSHAVLEIGSGTGQHAVYFSARLAHLHWQPTERVDVLATLQARLAEEGGGNLLPAMVLDVGDERWPVGPFDGVFTANTLHIMGWPEVCRCFGGVGRLLSTGGVFAIYGPFRRHGHTHDSNERFDLDLKARDPVSGIRDIDDLEALGTRVGLSLAADIALPANNQLLIWRRD